MNIIGYMVEKQRCFQTIKYGVLKRNDCLEKSLSAQQISDLTNYVCPPGNKTSESPTRNKE
ncbi:hypothetical protein CS542_10255 [Pedobacter sp. IW39]|nr:hypothetical protein CS542_10255 [Pedobacter sp. IW39]